MTPYTWRKSTHSGASNGSCIEVADAPSVTLPVRDSKDPGGPALTFTVPAWSAFLAALKSGAL